MKYMKFDNILFWSLKLEFLYHLCIIWGLRAKYFWPLLLVFEPKQQNYFQYWNFVLACIWRKTSIFILLSIILWKKNQ